MKTKLLTLLLLVGSGCVTKKEYLANKELTRALLGGNENVGYAAHDRIEKIEDRLESIEKKPCKFQSGMTVTASEVSPSTPTWTHCIEWEYEPRPAFEIVRSTRTYGKHCTLELVGYEDKSVEWRKP